MEVVSKLRELSVKKQVPCQLQNRTEVEKYIRSSIKKKIPEERIRHEGVVYKMLGFLPPDYDYLNQVIALYTEQLGGYYDPEKKQYVMAAWMPAVIQMPIAVHELTHALQDQHFNLEKLIDQEHESSDTVLAHTALIEGDATAVMLDYTRRLNGQPSIAKDESVSLFLIQNVSGAMLSPTLRQAPSAIQASMLFPYVSGLNFAHVLLRKGGYRQLDRAFARPPDTTAEILHPDKYLSGKTHFIKVENPLPLDKEVLKSEKPVYTDTVGEFFISTLLGTWLPAHEASRAASAWRGDRAALYEKKDGSGEILLWDTRWASEEDSRKFLDNLKRAYSIRLKKEAAAEQGLVRFNDTKFGPIELAANGDKVLIQVGK